MRQRSIQFDNVNIAYYESGEKGKPVVFLHGNSLSAAIFVKQFIDPILVEKYRLIAIDFPGCGDSDKSAKPSKDYMVSGLSKIVVDFCTNLGLEDAVFIGHSLGGNILLDCVDKLPNPKAIALLSSPPVKNPMAENTYLQHPAIPLFFKPKLTDGEVFLMSSSLFEPETPYPEFIPEIIRKSDPKFRTKIYDSIKEVQYKDQAEILEQIGITTAVFYGRGDQLVNFEYLKDISVPTLWNREIEIIQDSGHMFFYENPADFNAILAGFLEQVI